MPTVPNLSKTELDLFVYSRLSGCHSSASFRPGFLLRRPPRSIHKRHRVPVPLSRPLRASAAVSDSTTTASDSSTGTPNQPQAAVPEAELARRQKISNANRGKVPWNKGVPRTEGEGLLQSSQLHAGHAPPLAVCNALMHQVHQAD